MAIGNKIKRIRTFRNMTQRKVGKALGWDEKGLNRLVQNETNYASLHQLIFKFLFSCIAFCIRPEAAHQDKPLIYFIKAIVAYLCFTIRHINSRQTNSQRLKLFSTKGIIRARRSHFTQSDSLSGSIPVERMIFSFDKPVPFPALKALALLSAGQSYGFLHLKSFPVSDIWQICGLYRLLLNRHHPTFPVFSGNMDVAYRMEHLHR